MCLLGNGVTNIGTKALSNHIYIVFELAHDKTNKMAGATSKDSDQPGHLPSLMRVSLSA